LAALGSLVLALVLSIVGIFLDRRRVFAIIGAAIAGLTALTVVILIAIAYISMATRH